MTYHANLRAAGNPDRGQYCGYGILAPSIKIQGQTIEEMSSQIRDWIDSNDLGSGNFGP